MESVDMRFLQVFSFWYFYGLYYFSQQSNAKGMRADPKSPVVISGSVQEAAAPESRVMQRPTAQNSGADLLCEGPRDAILPLAAAPFAFKVKPKVSGKSAQLEKKCKLNIWYFHLIPSTMTQSF